MAAAEHQPPIPPPPGALRFAPPAEMTDAEMNDFAQYVAVLYLAGYLVPPLSVHPILWRNG